jgi:hypothetical protein
VASHSADRALRGRTSPSKSEDSGAKRRHSRRTPRPFGGGGFASATNSILATVTALLVKREIFDIGIGDFPLRFLLFDDLSCRPTAIHQSPKNGEKTKFAGQIKVKKGQ